MKKKINLGNFPSKSYFTIEEVAENWEQETETIYDYIDQKILVTALRSKKNGIEFLCKYNEKSASFLEIIKSSVINQYKEFLYSDKKNIDLSSDFKLPVGLMDEVAIFTLKKDDMPDFLYSIKSELIVSPMQAIPVAAKGKHKYFLIVKDFKNNKYMLVGGYGPTVTPVHPYMFNVISKEEVERFEGEYSIYDEVSGKRIFPAKLIELSTLEIETNTDTIIEKNTLIDTNKSRIIAPNFPTSQDDMLKEVIGPAIIKYEQFHRHTASVNELWFFIKNDLPINTVFNKKSKSIVFDDGKPLDKEAFRKRYKRYYPNKTAVIL